MTEYKEKQHDIMDCEQMEDLLSLYMDKMTTEDEKFSVERHLELCPTCRQSYDELLEIKSLLRSLPQEEVPIEFDLRLKEALMRETSELKKNSTKVLELQENPNFRYPSTKKNNSNLRIIVSLAAIFMVGLLSFITVDQFNFTQNKGDEQATGGQIVQESQKKQEDLTLGETPQQEEERALEIATELLNPIKSRQSSIIERGDSGEHDGNADTGSDSNYSNSSNRSSSPDEFKVGDEAVDRISAVPSKSSLNDEAQPGSGQPQVAMLSPDADSQVTNVASSEEKKEYDQYIGLIYKELEGKNYKIISYEKKNNGTWEFKVFIFNKNDDNILDKELFILGQGGTITIWENES